MPLATVIVLALIIGLPTFIGYKVLVIDQQPKPTPKQIETALEEMFAEGYEYACQELAGDDDDTEVFDVPILR